MKKTLLKTLMTIVVLASAGCSSDSEEETLVDKEGIKIETTLEDREDTKNPVGEKQSPTENGTKKESESSNKKEKVREEKELVFTEGSKKENKSSNSNVDKKSEKKSSKEIKKQAQTSGKANNPTKTENKKINHTKPSSNAGELKEPSKPNKPKEPNKPAHKHDYKPVYKTVKVPAVTKEEKKWVVTKSAEKKQYRRTIYTSNDTGKTWVYDPRTMSEADADRIGREIDDYNIEQALSGGYGSNMVNFENYWHETPGEGYWDTRTVVVTPETSKKVVDYEACSCGAKR